MDYKTKREIEIAEKIGRSPFITGWAIDYIESRLPDYKGSDNYGCDLADVLTESPNIDGSYIIGRRASWNFISEHVNDARDEYDYEKTEFGEVFHNPFENPEAFVCCMLINVVHAVMSRVPTVVENWDYSFELTETAIRDILGFLGRYEGKQEETE